MLKFNHIGGELMLKNRLAKIMHDKKVKAIEISRETGISRATLSKISNNITDRIEYDTIDKICLFLNIEPKDFFDYLPIDYTIELLNNDLKYGFSRDEHYQLNDFIITSYSFDLLIDISANKNLKRFIVSLTSDLVEYDTDNGIKTEVHPIYTFESENKAEEYKKIINSIPSTFQSDITEKLQSEFQKAIHEALDGKMKDLFDDNETDEIINYSYYNHLAPIDIHLGTLKYNFNF